MMGRLLRLLLLGCIACMLAGCASQEMKATPFFTGEYEEAEGSAEERVNLWPLAYYRKPALSVLWPVGEVTKKHVAVRPIFSVRKLDKDHPKIRVLWPLSELDFDTKKYWFLPAFWGTQDSGRTYFVLFPLVWWIPEQIKGVLPVLWEKDWLTVLPLYWQEPGKATLFPFFWYHEGRYVGVFPLFLHYDRPGGSSLHLLWPLVNVKTGDGEKGWRAWPLYGHYYDDYRSRRYALWPLAMSLRAGEECTRWILPLYLGRSTPAGRWDLALPFFFRSQYGHEKRMALLPFYYARDDEEGWTRLTPIYMGGRKPGRAWDLIMPLFFRSKSPDARTTVVLPALYDSVRGDERNTLLFPLFYRRAEGNDRILLTPLGGATVSADKRTLYAFPLLSAYSTSPRSKELWALYPLGHWRWEDGLAESRVLPLYYWDRGRGLFLSLPFSRKTKGDTKFVNVLGPLFHYTRDAQSRALHLLWPLARVRTAEDRLSHHVLPLWFYSRGGQRRHLNVGVALLDYLREPGRKRLWALFPFAGGEWKGDGKRHHVWPLYWYQSYGEERSLELGPFLPDGDSSKRPMPALSLADASWGEDHLAHGVWPLYVYQRGPNGRSLHLGPFILGEPGERPRSGVSLIGASSSENKKKLWLVPLGYNRGKRTVPLTAGGATHDVEMHDRSFLAFPLVFYDSFGPARKPLERLPVPQEQKAVLMADALRLSDSSLLVPPLFRYARDGVFEEDQKAPAEKTFWLLGWLYDYKKEVVKPEGEEEEKAAADGQKWDTYVRSRVLWHVMHYERLNDHKTLDLFPGITYDSKPGEKKVFSFLWRVIRYDWDKEEGTRLHLLFIPF